MNLCLSTAFLHLEKSENMKWRKQTVNSTAIQLLEYNKIKETLKDYAVSEMGKERIQMLEPSTDVRIIEDWLLETSEARRVINRGAGVPLYNLENMEKTLVKIGKGAILTPGELWSIYRLLDGVQRMKRYMTERRDVAPTISTYAFSMYELEELAGEISRCIVDNRVDDRASAELSRLRKKIGILEERIKSKLEGILRSPVYKDYIQEAMVSLRNGVYVIPVRREHRKNIEGDVLDTSTSGSTVFIEPAAVKRLREELSLLRIEQEKEEYRILSTLTAMVDGCHREVSINIETMVHYDFLFAKAKYSKALDANTVELNTHNHIHIIGGRHPIIGKSAVPLNFTIGRSYRTLVITGPNTGGKTVALKTVGLLTLMVQSGLHVPVEEGSNFGVFRDVLVDIGDGQSIEQSLSTFSSHIRNIISIMECADPYTLVIMDELGTGTDPSEGMGIAIAVLEEIFERGATTLATTHYSEIKDYANQKEGFENGCMEFDINTLKPLYRLRIGESGQSNAFLIALRLGMDRRIIERAHAVTYKEKKDYAGVYREIPKQEVKNAEITQQHEAQLDRAKKLQETRQKVEKQKIEHAFQVGDCVYISTMNRTGIVCELENHRGEVGVMVMKNKFKVNRKRLSLYVESKELYPEEYNLDIVLESKENRKKKKQMGKRHIEGMEIKIQ